jgi:hypothetical protein
VHDIEATKQAIEAHRRQYHPRTDRPRAGQRRVPVPRS